MEKSVKPMSMCYVDICIAQSTEMASVDYPFSTFHHGKESHGKEGIRGETIQMFSPFMFKIHAC